MKDCTFITNELLDQMVIGKIYDLQELYRMIENTNLTIDDYRHKIRAVLEKRVIAGKYQIVYHGNAEYSLWRDDDYNGTYRKEVA